MLFVELDRAVVDDPTWRQEYLVLRRPHPNEGDVVHRVQIPVVGRNECGTRRNFEKSVERFYVYMLRVVYAPILKFVCPLPDCRSRRIREPRKHRRVGVGRRRVHRGPHRDSVAVDDHDSRHSLRRIPVGHIFAQTTVSSSVPPTL